MELDLKELSTAGLKALTTLIEERIRSHRAALEDYDLYIRCLQELAGRKKPARPGKPLLLQER